jgi:predicted nucleotidyltransferase
MVTDELPETCERFGVTLVVVFGSRVKGTAKSGSDVDMGVWLAAPDIAPERELELIRALVLATREGNLDVMILNHADPLLGYHVVRDGVLLYEHEPGTFDWYRLWAWKRYLDTDKFRKLESEYVNAFLSGEVRHARQARNREKAQPVGRVAGRFRADPRADNGHPQSPGP